MKERIFGLDFLRASMILLGVVFHGLELHPHVSVLDHTWNNRLFNFIANSIHSFRMPLFFCLSGYFAGLLMKKNGLKKFLINRIKRILIPFLVSLYTIGLLTSVLYLTISGLHRGLELMEALQLAVNVDTLSLNIAPVHLWYLNYLFCFILILVLLVSIRRLIRRKVVFLISSSIFKKWFLLGVVIGSVIVSFSLYSNEYRVAPNTQLVIDISHFLYYLYFFIFGTLLYEGQFNFQSLSKNCYLFLLSAAILTLFHNVLWTSKSGSLTFNIMVAVYTATTWLYMFGFFGLAAKYFNSQSSQTEYIADASYWIYLIHYPILLGFKLIFPFGVSALGFVCILIVTILLCLISFNFLVRPTAIGLFLSGKKAKVEQIPFTRRGLVQILRPNTQKRTISQPTN